MKKCSLAVFARLLAIVLGLVAALVASAGEGAPAPRIVLVGDSTVTDNAGWGLGFKQFLADGVTCVNTAQGGRSSMSFIKEGRWADALALKGEYYLIQFGHNDEPGKPGRSTTIEEYRAYMNQYVDEARAAGAKPVLVTSLVRRQFEKADDHKISSSLEPRAAVVREIAAAKNVPLIELHDRSKELCEKLGRVGCYSFSPTKEGDKYDGTHLKGEGHVMFARLVVEELRKAVPELAQCLRSEPAKRGLAPAETSFDAVVSFDGSGTHTTVQAAVDAAPDDGKKPFIILIKPGVYREHVHVPKNKPFVVLRGEPAEVSRTVISLGTNLKSVDAAGKKLTTRDSATVLVQGSDFTAENLTFENTTTRQEKVQALAMYAEADRVVFRRCRFIGWQDTLRAEKGRQYYLDCEISGHVDFIYGAATAVFERCLIHCRADGYITAASTSQEQKYGYVFLDCRVTAGPDVDKGVYLGRPWRPHAAVAFLRTELPHELHVDGWHNWGKAENEKTARYAEYRNTGPGARPDVRVAWSRQLKDEEAAACTVGNILGGADRWNPAATFTK